MSIVMDTGSEWVKILTLNFWQTTEKSSGIIHGEKGKQTYLMSY